FRLAAEEHVLLLSLHHIITDGWSMGVLVREVSELYAAFVAGRSSPLPALPLQYASFASWQRQWLLGEALDTQLSYWRQRLDPNAVLQLPGDRPRPATSSARGARHTVCLPAQLAESLKDLGASEGRTLFSVLLAAFNVLLHRYCGHDDVTVGTPIAGRNRADLEGLIGLFVNTLAVRTDLSGDPTFQQLVGRVHETALGAFAH
ncbi:condensation domain-containing protein, partial [Pyxidicoccus caerfyrddinensis]|uniref:condensation domain-containing protein n=1 Tax=Pyxidicoccus caerfyrddinensis TaxID=2709663 RepID=UPI001F0786D5